jgi:hypothetical protein
MAASLPRLGCDNLLWDNRLHLRATTELDSDSVVGNLADWTGGRYWKPTFASNPPATEYIYCYPLATTDRINVPNWYFRDWSDGAAAAPDNWSLTGAGASVARSATMKIDLYSTEVTRAGADCYLGHTAANPTTYNGRELTMGAWIKAADANTGRITIYTDSGSTSSSYHTGGGAWEFITVTHEIEFDATTIELRCEVNSNNVAVSFDGVGLYYGDTCNATPHAEAVTYLAGYDHNLGTGGFTLSLEYMDDQAAADPYDWSASTELLTISPSDDTSLWVDAATQSKRAWRLKFTPAATGSPAAYMAVASFGSYIELPYHFSLGFNPNDRTLRSELVRTSNGPPVQRGIRSTPVRLSFALTHVDESFVTGDFKTFWDHAGDSGSPGGLPFFLQWDDGDHSGQTFFCSLPEGATKNAPMIAGLRTAELRVECEAVPE